MRPEKTMEKNKKIYLPKNEEEKKSAEIMNNMVTQMAENNLKKKMLVRYTPRLFWCIVTY